MTTESSALTLPPAEALPALFRKPDEIDRLISAIETEVRGQAADVSTRKGRSDIASLAHKVARSKTALDDAGKRLNEGLRSQINVVDAERRKVRERFDALKEEVRKPLTEWEEAEAERVEKIKAKVAKIVEAGSATDDVAGLIARLKACKIDESYAEFENEAHRAKDDAIAKLEVTLAEQRRIEAERAELERLRAEAAEREEADRKRREAAAAEAARVAAEKAEAERQAEIERLRQEAVERAAKEAKERAEREAAEAAAKAKAEQERRDREAAEREAELQRQIVEAKVREERAAQLERDRIEAEKKAEADARAKREADHAHRTRIELDITKSVKTLGLNSEDASKVAEALMAGKVPHCTVML